MFKKKLIRYLLLLKATFNNESDSNKAMLKTFYLYSKGEADKKDLQNANNQLKELLKDLGFGLLTSLPFSPITIPFILKLSKRYNVDIIPEWFKNSMK